MREGGFSTPLCHYAIILRPKNPTNDILNGITKTYLVGVQQLDLQMNQRWLSRLLFPDYCPPSPTEQSPTAAQSVAGVHPTSKIYCNICACAVHNNGQRRRVKKSDAGADEKLKINK